MATYGTRDATQFPLPSVESNERYYTLVERDTGKITLKRIVPLSFNESLDATVGTIEVSGPNAGKFVPGAEASATEKQAFAQQPQTVKVVKDKAAETVTKAKVKEGKDPQVAQTEANKLLSPNAASGGNEVDEAKLTESLAAEDKETRNSFRGAKGGDPLVYPLTLRDSKQDVIKFRMVQYSPKKFDRTQLDKDLTPFTNRRGIEDKNTIGVVILPIPSGISDNNSVSWSQDTLNPLQANLVNIANASITQGFGVGAETASQTVGNVGNNSSDVQAAVANVFTEAVVGTTNLLSRTKGAIYNPNMELLFNAPSLRPFNFTFKLSARSKREAEAIRTIIRFFKQGMSPIRTQSQLFLKAPHTFQLEYLHQGKQHNYLNEFKECALQSFSVDYTPEGQYATFTDGAMVSYQITMQFQELEPVFNDDYGLGSGSSGYDTKIGY
jgi:hypothetical protein